MCKYLAMFVRDTYDYVQLLLRRTSMYKQTERPTRGGFRPEGPAGNRTATSTR